MAAEDDFKPPQELEQRQVAIQSETLNTVEVPCDPRDPDFQRWYDTGAGMQPLRQNNKVSYLIDGASSFAAMNSALATATSAEHYIYMLNWYVDLTISLAAGSPSLLDVLTAAVSNGVQVRGMFWDQVGFQNNAGVKAINKLNNPGVAGANGGAILDDNTLNFTRLALPRPRFYFGSHHQKMLIVKGSEGLTAFCGGIDFNTDRILSVSRQAGSPMHDVHCRIQGPAAWDLLQIFLQRWGDHPDANSINTKKGALRGAGEGLPGASGLQYVQIGRTYGNGSAHDGIRNARGQRFYSFAPTGERTAERAILHAIGQAKKYIYIEDQYLVSMDVSNKLLAQLPAIQKLIILIPHPSISDHPHIWAANKAFIDNLGGDPKVVVCYKKEPGAVPNPREVPATAFGIYVHAKMWIMDDKFAIIGSANCGQRSYTFDSEVVAGIYDESKDSPCTLHFAHALRIALWAQHLRLKPADVFDPLGSAAHWMKPAQSAGVAAFDQNADTDSPWKASNQAYPDEAEPFGG